MSVILLMIPAALLLAGLGVAAFVIAARRGQFDDLDTPALRAVFDDDDTVPEGDSDAKIHDTVPCDTAPDRIVPDHGADAGRV